MIKKIIFTTLVWIAEWAYDKVVKMIDTDHDGKISEDEIVAVKEKFKAFYDKFI